MSYTGKCLEVDLSSGAHKIHAVDKDLVREYIGGKGLGFALLDKISPRPDPLGPDNPLIFVNGPFTGTKVQTSARTTLVTQSPLTRSAHDSHCGGNFGPAIKRAGFDYILITGRAAKPVYLYVTDEKVEIREAGSLWGKGIFTTTDELLRRHKGYDPRVAAIGPAGENLLAIACIGVDKHRNYGRGGVGAVMGSKNLKAVVADGRKAVRYFDEERFMKVNKEFARAILTNEAVKYRRVKGTMKCVRSGQELEYLPTQNWRKVQFDDFEKISSETARKVLHWEDTGCFNCSIRCAKWARWDGHKIEGPEYETTAFLGSNCMVNDIKEIALSNEMCNDLGLDTISTGGTIGFAMECYEKGLIDDWNGIDLEWGNAEAQRRLIEMMVSRKGVGALFADGTRSAASKIGKGSEEFAVNIYGMEMSGINPLGALTMGVAMAVADFASHTRLWIAEQELGPDFKIEQIPYAVSEGIDIINVRNCLVICDFVPEGLDSLAGVLTAAAGYKHTGESLQKIGEKITNLARRYNLRNGRTAADDMLPERFFKETSLAGFMRGKKLGKAFFKGLVGQYYKLKGWNEKGEPPALS